MPAECDGRVGRSVNPDLLERFPEIDLATNKVGIFGKAAALSATLTEGDRIEIYRPLIADPKEARKKRAAEGKAMKKGARAQGADRAVLIAAFQGRRH